jgi:hypothetical protein
MPLFYPPIDFEAPVPAGEEINYAELAVLEALDKGLDDKWHVFHRVHWREVNPQGEKIGEADAVIFHPSYGILVIEIKGGGIRSKDGEWFQTSLRTGTEYKLDRSPFQQARTGRFHFSDMLKRTSLGGTFEPATAFTYTVWLPDITWTGPIPPDAPNGAFILDSRHLANPVQHIRNILRQSNPHAKPWDAGQARVVVNTLAPEFNLLVPLGVRIGQLRDRIFRMTDSQLRAYKALKQQKRLLVEGCAGSGKTLVAVSLAREHLSAGKRVLFTCYNRRLARVIEKDFAGTPGIEAVNFHELAKKYCDETGAAYSVPDGEEDRKRFFRNTCAELLLDCSGRSAKRYDTIIVDEAFDFQETWWTALEALGGNDFSFYVFFDRHQAVFTDSASWKPPFDADPIVLEANVRNTRPIGRFAAKLGGTAEAPEYGVNEGPEPALLSYKNPEEIPGMLKTLLAELTGKQKIPAGSIVILSPYKPDHERLGLQRFVKEQERTVSTDLEDAKQSRVRIGTIQSFKGLEADVVILCGIDGHLPACSPANLYVGATRARSMLYVMHQAGWKAP